MTSMLSFDCFDYSHFQETGKKSIIKCPREILEVFKKYLFPERLHKRLPKSLLELLNNLKVLIC